MKCDKHPEKDAVAACINCGRLLCEECKIRVDGKNYCEDCVKQINSPHSEHYEEKIPTNTQENIVISESNPFTEQYEEKIIERKSEPIQPSIEKYEENITAKPSKTQTPTIQNYEEPIQQQYNQKQEPTISNYEEPIQHRPNNGLNGPYSDKYQESIPKRESSYSDGRFSEKYEEEITHTETKPHQPSITKYDEKITPIESKDYVDRKFSEKYEETIDITQKSKPINPSINHYAEEVEKEDPEAGFEDINQYLDKIDNLIQDTPTNSNDFDEYILPKDELEEKFLSYDEEIVPDTQYYREPSNPEINENEYVMESEDIIPDHVKQQEKYREPYPDELYGNERDVPLKSSYSKDRRTNDYSPKDKSLEKRHRLGGEDYRPNSSKKEINFVSLDEKTKKEPETQGDKIAEIGIGVCLGVLMILIILFILFGARNGNFDIGAFISTLLSDPLAIL